MSCTLVTDEIDRPDIDTRIYRLIRLENELEVLLVHDPDTDKASAALDVHVGHLSDPWDVAGLAHFCEHLLFMGTEKYPKENDYSEYLSAHNGSSNAFTGTVDTNYFFDVGHEYLEPALDRFSQFFISPLFLESCKDRELLAVDSENKKNLQNDMWRAYQLEKSLSNPEHVYSKFGTGNLDTLKIIPSSLGNDVREELLKFHKELYSANQMKLVLLGRNSLDELQALAVQKFSAITNLNKAATVFPGEILRPEHELGSIYTFKPVKETRNLELCFPIPECDTLWTSQPSHYISHLIGHEGEGSILSYLKNRNWVLYLGAGGSDASPGTDFFKINMELTQEGAENWQKIVEVIFAYIDILKREGLQSWIFEELRLISEAQFKYKERQPPSRFTSSIAGKLHSSIDKRYILGTTVPREYRPHEISQVLDALNHKNFRVALADPAVQGPFEKEKYYGTEYRLDRLPSDLLERCAADPENSFADLHLPIKNDFVPEHFAVSQKTIDTKATSPTLIKNTPYARIWHKKDDTFWVPKANYICLIRNPLFRQSAETACMTKLFLELLKDDLNEFAYNADIAGLQYAMDPSVGLFSLTFSGYNDKMSVLIDKVVSRMKYLHVRNDRFSTEKDRLIRELGNFDYESPYAQVAYHLSHLQAHTTFSKQEQLKALTELELETMRAFHSTMFDAFHIEVLAHGNLTEDEVLSTTQSIEDTLAGRTSVEVKEKAIVLLKTKSVPDDPYEKAFMDKGYRPYFVPVLEHKFTNLDALQSRCARASDEFSGLIVTSQRSVEAIGMILPRLDPMMKDRLFDMPVYTVGPATRGAIENLGFSNVLGSESGNGDALATFILSTRSREESRPLFFAVGDKRRDIISKRMAASSMPLLELIVYETVTATDFPQDFRRVISETSNVEWLVFFSPAGADVALKNLKSSGNSTKVATIGPTTEEYLVNQWSLCPTIVSPKPDADSLVNALLRASYKKPEPLAEEDTRPMRALWMPTGSSWLSNKLKDPSNTNSCIEYFVQFGPSSDIEQVTLSQLFAQVCSEPAFNQLRTKEQLGYIVFSGQKMTLTSNGFRILIQSEKDAAFLASRVDAFLDFLKGFLTELPDEDFQKQKNSLIDKLNEKMKNLGQETKRYLSHIASGLYDFNSTEEKTRLLRSFDKTQLLDFFMTYVHHSSPSRRHVIASMDAHSSVPETTHEGAALPAYTVLVEDIARFKSTCKIMDATTSTIEACVGSTNESKL